MIQQCLGFVGQKKTNSQKHYFMFFPHLKKTFDVFNIYLIISKN